MEAVLGAPSELVLRGSVRKENKNVGSPSIHMIKYFDGSGRLQLLPELFDNCFLAELRDRDGSLTGGKRRPTLHASDDGVRLGRASGFL